MPVLWRYLECEFDVLNSSWESLEFCKFMRMGWDKLFSGAWLLDYYTNQSHGSVEPILRLTNLDSKYVLGLEN